MDHLYLRHVTKLLTLNTTASWLAFVYTTAPPCRHIPSRSPSSSSLSHFDFLLLSPTPSQRRRPHSQDHTVDGTSPHGLLHGLTPPRRRPHLEGAYFQVFSRILTFTRFPDRAGSNKSWFYFTKD